MRRRPRPPAQPLLSGFLLWRIAFVSILFVMGVFGMFEWATARGLGIETARTMVVNTLVVMEVAYLFNVRFLSEPWLTWRGLLGTRAVLIAVAVVTAAQFAQTYLPPLQAVFETRPLALVDGLAVVAAGVALFATLEAEKWLKARLGLGAYR